jgi:hypothetical protein
VGPDPGVVRALAGVGSSAGGCLLVASAFELDDQPGPPHPKLETPAINAPPSPHDRHHVPRTPQAPAIPPDERCGQYNPARGTRLCALQPLDAPRCCGRRNCDVNLNNLDWDRPDVDCEPQQARGIPRNLQVDETTMTARRPPEVPKPTVSASVTSSQMGIDVRVS